MKLLKKYPFTLLCTIVIWYLSFFTPPPTKLDDVVGIDKLVHTAMYGGWCFLFWWEHLRTRYRRNNGTLNYLPVQWGKAFWYALFAPSAMGGLIEILQENCTNHRRSGDWWDFGANTLGVVLMYFIARIIERNLVLRYLKPMYRWLNLKPRQSAGQAR